MPTSTPPGAARCPPPKRRPWAHLVHTTYGSTGQRQACYTFFADLHILYVRWQGHFTGDDFVEAAAVGLQINEGFF